MPREFYIIATVLFSILLIASLVAWQIGRRHESETVDNLKARINSWWVMVIIFFGCITAGPTASVILFGLVSFFALREFLTLTPTARADHRSLFWAFFIITPIQYFLIGIQWYGLSSIFIPVFGFVAIPIRRALAGETKDYLASVSRIQWGLLVCVYFISHLPLIMQLPIPGYAGKEGLLLLFLVICVQASDVFQYIWGKLIGKTPIAPNISPNKTKAGFYGGIATTTILGALLSTITPFNLWQGAVMALVISLAGFFGGLVMSAIKRDLGAKDWGHAIPGHGGFTDRIDSLCFAAPLFFHLTGFFFGTGIERRPSFGLWEELISRFSY